MVNQFIPEPLHLHIIPLSNKYVTIELFLVLSHLPYHP